MTHRTAKYRGRRFNQYVPACAYAADMIHEGPYDIVFGPLAAASATSILNGQSIATAGSTSTFVGDTVDPTTGDGLYPYGPGYGRSLALVASGASTSVVTIRGKDYLGQPVREDVTLNGATPVNSVKAFKYVDSIAWTATASTTINVGTTARLGLPYRMENVISEQLDGVRVATLGTLVAPSYVDPQTAITGDPRGLYTPTSTLNGTAVLSCTMMYNERLNANGNGGVHGLAHFYS